MPVPNRREASRCEQARRDITEASEPLRTFSQKSKDFCEGYAWKTGLDSFGIVTLFSMSRVFSEAHVPGKHEIEFYFAPCGCETL